MYSPAVFIGADGSCGLKHGQSYMIKISNHPRRYYVHVKGKFGIPYDTISAINNNWKLPTGVIDCILFKKVIVEPDIKKVINGLECCMSESQCYKCPYKSEDECENGKYYYSKAIEDAITLLREQESVKPELRMTKHGFKQWIVCGSCHGKIYGGDDYCRHCGRKLMWE